MRKLLFLVLVAVLLGGCTQVEDDEEETKNENSEKTITIVNETENDLVASVCDADYYIQSLNAEYTANPYQEKYQIQIPASKTVVQNYSDDALVLLFYKNGKRGNSLEGYLLGNIIIRIRTSDIYIKNNWEPIYY